MSLRVNTTPGGQTALDPNERVLATIQRVRVRLGSDTFEAQCLVTTLRIICIGQETRVSLPSSLITESKLNQPIFSASNFEAVCQTVPGEGFVQNTISVKIEFIDAGFASFATAWAELESSVQARRMQQQPGGFVPGSTDAAVRLVNNECEDSNACMQVQEKEFTFCWAVCDISAYAHDDVLSTIKHAVVQRAPAPPEGYFHPTTGAVYMAQPQSTNVSKHKKDD